MRKLSKVTVIILISLLTGGLFLIYLLTRKTKGFKNNPLGIEYVRQNDWIGTIRPHNGHRFESFKSVEYGVRAGAIILRNYKKIGVVTLESILNRWAPSVENDINSYIDFAESQTGFDSKSVIDVDNDVIMFKILKAIATYETSYNLSESTFIKSQNLIS